MKPQKGSEIVDDNIIIELFWERSADAISETDKKYRPYCHSIAYNILFDERDAEECINDTWLGAWNAIPPNRPAILKTFLGKLTRRLSLVKLRNQKRLKRGGGEAAIALEELGDCIAASDSVEKTIEEKELTKAVNVFLETLKDTERDVFVCRYWYFASISQISKSFGFSETKTKSMLFRIRNKLREYLEEAYFI